MSDIIRKLVDLLQKYRFNLLLYVLFVAVLIFDFLWFFEIVERPLSWEYPPAIIFNVSTAFLLSLIYFVPRRYKGLIFIYLGLITTYLVGNALYFRTYYTIIPIDSFTMVENLNGLKESIFSSFRWADSAFLLSFLSLIATYYLFLKVRMVAERGQLRLKTTAVIFFLISLVIGNQLYQKRNDVSNLLSQENDFRYDLIEGASSYGFVSCWIWQSIDFFSAGKSISTAEQHQIESWLANHAEMEKIDPMKADLKRNVILLVVESLESFPIEKKINGIEITPNLNQLLSGDSCFFADHVVPQVKDGRSSDAQLIINSGLLPLSSGATCFRNPHNRYFTLAKALQSKGYSTTTLLGGNASFWNQGVFNKSLGYDKLISIDQFRYDETYEFGLTDSSFFAQSIEQLSALPKPFFAQMITLSSHAPFTLIDGRIYLQTPKECPKYIADYLNAIHYVDICIGRFISDLKKAGLFHQTTIVITGDHDAFSHKPYLRNSCCKTLFGAQSYNPLIVLNASAKGRYTAAMGQIDIYPTLLHLLGASDYAWHGLGFSIFDERKSGFAIDAKMNVVSDLKSVPDSIFQQALDAWQVSDLIIRKNYFDKK
ncbi:MAG: LTA synthase family protein [Bacteroidales bacterium]